MVENINQHHCVEQSVRIGNRAAIKGFEGDSRIRTNQGVQARNRDIRPLLGDNKIQCSIAASYIQNARGLRNERGYALRQCANSPAKDKFLMQHASDGKVRDAKPIPMPTRTPRRPSSSRIRPEGLSPEGSLTDVAAAVMGGLNSPRKFSGLQADRRATSLAADPAGEMPCHPFSSRQHAKYAVARVRTATPSGRFPRAAISPQISPPAVNNPCPGNRPASWAPGRELSSPKVHGSEIQSSPERAPLHACAFRRNPSKLPRASHRLSRKRS